MAAACDECADTIVTGDMVAPIICSCNEPVGGGGSQWIRKGTACGVIDTGHWSDPYLEGLCAGDITGSPPLLQTEFTCEHVPCGELEAPGGYSCSGWDPEGMVWYSDGVYAMFGTDLSALVDDLYPLIFCDDARFQKLEGDGFEVQDADAGELLYELGLRDGDVPVDLNGYPLADVGDVAIAFVTLWLINGEDLFELTVIRDEGHVALDYAVEFQF